MIAVCAGYWAAVVGRSGLSNPYRPRSKSWTRWLYGHFAGLVALGEIDANPVRAR